MNNEIEVGEWIRTEDGQISKNNSNYNWDLKETYINDSPVVKHSKNIIDLIEVGDYVNGWKVLAKTKIKNNEMQVCILTCFEDEHWITINNETLKTIVTKESFKEKEYVF